MGAKPFVPQALAGNDRVQAVFAQYAHEVETVLRRRPELAAAPGEGVHCPCCGGEFTHFDPFRHKPEHPWRENACCPACGSLERHRRLWVTLCEESGLFAGGRLLHFAPEAFLRRIFLASATEYVDCDLQTARAGKTVDITALPFEAESFDWCLCCHVLEHVDEDRTALGELRRVLRPGATAWLMVPTLKEGTMVHEPPPNGFTPNDHRREYGLDDFVGRCEAAGFAVEVLHAKSLSPELRARHRLSNHVYRCSRM